MIISDQGKLLKIQEKLTKAPELRRLSITEDGNLFVEGCSRRLLFTDFVALSPRGSYGRIGGERYPAPEEPQEALPIGLVTEKKLLLNIPFNRDCYISLNNPPQEEDYFLLILLYNEFCEFLYLDGNMKTPFHLLQSPGKQDALVGLTITLTRLYDKGVAEHLQYYLDRGVTE